MKNVKIGIIDSGISSDFLKSEPFNLKSAAYFKLDWNERRLSTQTIEGKEIRDNIKNGKNHCVEDDSGHGTAVASILHRNIRSPVDYHVAKVLDENTSGSSICLLHALSWMLNHVEADFINMSLGTNNFKFSPHINVLVSEAVEKGCKIFSASGNVPTLPSELDSVVSVGVRDSDHVSDVKVDCVSLVDSHPIFIDGTWVSYQLSTSYACPLMLANVCNIENGH